MCVVSYRLLITCMRMSLAGAGPDGLKQYFNVKPDAELQVTLFQSDCVKDMVQSLCLVAEMQQATDLATHSQPQA